MFLSCPPKVESLAMALVRALEVYLVLIYNFVLFDVQYTALGRFQV